jgi:hypothetical protein
MPYNNVFLIEDGDKVLGLYYSYDKAVSAIHRIVQDGDPRDGTPFIQVWKNIVYYEDGRRPSKGWTWREFLMVSHLYTPEGLR